MINALLVRWAKGWHEVTDVDAIAAHGRHEGTLALGVEQSVAEVERVGAGQLAVAPREEIAVDLDPTGPADTPYAAFGVADVVTVPGLAGGPTQERVTALTVAEDENGRLSWVPELKDVLLTHDERMEQAIARMANGALGGTSAVASPMPLMVTPAPIPKVGGGGGDGGGGGTGAGPMTALFRGSANGRWGPTGEGVARLTPLAPGASEYHNGAGALFANYFEPAPDDIDIWVCRYVGGPAQVSITARFTWTMYGPITDTAVVWSHLPVVGTWPYTPHNAIDQGPHRFPPPGTVDYDPNYGFSYSDTVVGTFPGATELQVWVYQDYHDDPYTQVNWSLAITIDPLPASAREDAHG